MAAVFRVNKDRNYTVMSNYHLNDENISLKAKGLLSQMLSLPDTWDYTLRGLASINKERIDAIRTAVLELEQYGYITRRQLRDDGGRLSHTEYTIYEQPQPRAAPAPCLENPITVDAEAGSSPCLDYPITVNPYTENPVSDNPMSENPMQLNTKLANTKKENKQGENNHPINLSPPQPPPPSHSRDRPDGIDGMDKAESYRDLIMFNIEYDILVERWGAERMDEAVELILETVLSKREYIKIAGDEYPREVVKSRLLKVSSSHLEYVFDCIDKNTTKVRNIKSYLITALYNAPATMDSYYRAEVNHDLYGSDP